MPVYPSMYTTYTMLKCSLSAKKKQVVFKRYNILFTKLCHHVCYYYIFIIYNVVLYVWLLLPIYLYFLHTIFVRRIHFCLYPSRNNVISIILHYYSTEINIVYLNVVLTYRTIKKSYKIIVWLTG